MMTEDRDTLSHGPSRRSLVILALLVIILLLTLGLRVWSLNQAPPWLWWDEATQGLDARDLLHGHFQVFFPSAQGKEPLYVYLTTPFVAAWDGQPFAVRLAGALLGVLMVPAFWAAGRAMWWRRPQLGAWAGLAAASFWAVNFWPQSINRIGFQVNAFPLPLTLAVVAWLNWSHRPSRRRALMFGALAGMTLATYLAARITPVLWLALYLTLPRSMRSRLSGTIGWAALAFALVAAPLVAYFLLQPANALERVSMFANLYQAGTPQAQLALLFESARDVLGGFLGWAGDPIPRHNLSNRPPFDPALAALFGLGLLAALITIVRRGRSAGSDRQRAWTLLLWWGTLCLPAVFSASSNPHFPRLLGALPPALLLAAWPVAAAAGWLNSQPHSWWPPFRRLRSSGVVGPRPGARWATWALRVVVAGLILAEGAQTSQAYFGTWAKWSRLYTWYQGDMWTIGQQIAARPDSIGIVPADPSSVDGLVYAYRDLPIWQVEAGEDLPGTLDERLAGAGGKQVITPMWQEEPYVYADPQAAVPFYLDREGQAEGQQGYRGFDLLSFKLGPQPQFTAPGQAANVEADFGPGLTLTGAHWGAGYPNGDRNAAAASAGTPFWVVLDWRLAKAEGDLRVALDLIDAGGHRVASSEAPLVSDPGRAAPWQPDATWHTYHLVTAPATQPPGAVRLEARLYNVESGTPVLPDAGRNGVSVPIANAQVTAAQEPANDIALDQEVNADLGNGAALLGLASSPASAAPGETLTLQLFWRAGDGNYDSRPVTLTLGSGAASTTFSLPGGVPAGQVFHTYADLRLPATIAQGPQPVRLELGNGRGVDLTTVQVAGRPRQFAVPAVRQPLAATFGQAVELVGVDSPPVVEVAADQPVTVTLVWRAGSGPQGALTRFVHVLGTDGRPLAQHDSALCGGNCPSSSWLPGEVFADAVRIDIPKGAPLGEYAVATGWYDGTAQARLEAHDDKGQRAADDLVLLPVRIKIAR